MPHHPKRSFDGPAAAGEESVLGRKYVQPHTLSRDFLGRQPGLGSHPWPAERVAGSLRARGLRWGGGSAWSVALRRLLWA